MATAAVSRRVYFLLAGVVLLLDQSSKALIAQRLSVGEEQPVIVGLLNLIHIRNPGAALGLLSNSDSPWIAAFLIGFSVAASAVIIALLWRGSAGLSGVALGLILGGALGNLLDRVRLGSVVDFLDFRYWPFPFNLADSAIVLGAAGVMLQLLRRREWRQGEA